MNDADWWLCECQSLNNLSARRCYSCRRPKPKAPIRASDRLGYRVVVSWDGKVRMEDQRPVVLGSEAVASSRPPLLREPIPRSIAELAPPQGARITYWLGDPALDPRRLAPAPAPPSSPGSAGPMGPVQAPAPALPLPPPGWLPPAPPPPGWVMPAPAPPAWVTPAPPPFAAIAWRPEATLQPGPLQPRPLQPRPLQPGPLQPGPLPATPPLPATLAQPMPALASPPLAPSPPPAPSPGPSAGPPSSVGRAPAAASPPPRPMVAVPMGNGAPAEPADPAEDQATPSWPHWRELLDGPRPDANRLRETLEAGAPRPRSLLGGDHRLEWLPVPAAEPMPPDPADPRQPGPAPSGASVPWPAEDLAASRADTRAR